MFPRFSILYRIDAFSTYLLTSSSSSSSISTPTILTILWKHVTFLFCSRVSNLQPDSLQRIIDRIQTLTLHTASQFDFNAATRPSTSLSVDLDETPRVVSIEFLDT